MKKIILKNERFEGENIVRMTLAIALLWTVAMVVFLILALVIN